MGEVSYVETALLKRINKYELYSCYCPVGINDNEIYNINADTAAAGIAAALSAKRTHFDYGCRWDIT